MPNDRSRNAGMRWRTAALTALSLGALGAASLLAAEAMAAAARPLAPTITSHPASVTTSTSATFTFSDATPGVTFRCSLDRSSYSTCTSPKTYTSLSRAKHTFAVEAVTASTGKGGAKTSAPAKFSWTVNLPKPSFSVQPSTPTSSTSATFAFSDSVTGVTFQCSLDGARYRTCSSPTTYNGLAIDTHTFAVEAVMRRAPTSTPATVTWTITRTTVASTTTLDTPPALTYGYETFVSFTGSVTGITGDGSPTGTVSVVTTATPPVTLCTATSAPTSGDAANFTCTMTTPKLLTADAYTVHAHYAGGTSTLTGYAYTASTSAPQSLTVSPLTPTFTIQVTGGTSKTIAVGATATLSETGITATAGTVFFKTTNGTTLCTVTLPTTSCTTSTSLAAGIYTVSADFSPTSATANYTTSTSTNSVTLVVGTTLPSSTILQSHTTSTTYASGTLSFSGTVVGVSGEGYPTGTVTLLSTTGTTLCTTTLHPYTSGTTYTSYFNECRATTPTMLTVGTYSVHAHYTGGPSSDATYSYAASTSLSYPLTISPYTPSFTIYVTGTTTATITFGSTATLSETGLTLVVGTVAFKTASGTTLCTITLPTTSCSTSTSLPAGEYTITGYFSPMTATANYTTTTSGYVTLTVRTIQTTTTTLTVTPPTVTYGTETSVDFSGTVSGVVAGHGFPQGTVRVEASTGAILCTIGLTSSTTTSTVSTFDCTVTATFLAASTTPYTLTATYYPTPTTDSSSTPTVSYVTSTSTIETFTVTRATRSTTTSLDVTPLSVTYGTETTVTFSGTVVGVTGAGYPQGTVTVTDVSVTTLCTSTVKPVTWNGFETTFSCTTSATALDASPTSYPVSATFEPTLASSSSTPSVTYTGSTSTTSYLMVSPVSEATTTSLTVTPSTMTYLTAPTGTLTFSGSVMGVTGDGYPVGKVDVYWTTATFGGSFVCTATLEPGTGSTATYSCTAPATGIQPGTYRFYAYFTGSSSTPNYAYTPSTSTLAILTVTGTGTTTS